MKEAINILNAKFQAIKNEPEHPVFHPEGTLGNHISMVVLKAFIWDIHPDLIWAAILHDICKADESRFKKYVTLPEGSYWSNPMHDQQAANLIHESDAIKHAIWFTGGNWKNVARLCRWHMVAKFGNPPKESFKRESYGKTSFLDVFTAFDDMAGRETLPIKNKAFFFTPSHGPLVNVSVSKVVGNKEGFTIFTDFNPFNFSYEEIPEFFSFNEKWGFIKTILTEPLPPSQRRGA